MSNSVMLTFPEAAAAMIGRESSSLDPSTEQEESPTGAVLDQDEAKAGRPWA